MARSGLLAGSVAVLTAAVAAPEAVWLQAEDGVEIRGDLYALEADDKKSAPVILLFHQAGSNRGEYADIAPRLNEMGFHALAIDQRSGGARWGFENETVNKLGESTKYLAALPDLEAALKWKVDSGYDGTTLVWGSSYSASLVFLLAAGHGQIDGILSFSPGEYLGTRTDEVRKAAKDVSRPVIVLTPADERDRARQVVDAIPGEDKRFVIPDEAVHGSSMLVPDRNAGATTIWPEVETFLERFK
jgi:dienelactone hydrolase